MIALKHVPRGWGGFTLPELLVGMALGLSVVLIATAAYGSSKQTWAAIAAADAVHANARVALLNIKQQAQIAGGAYLITSHNDSGVVSAVISPADETVQPAVAGMNGSKNAERLTLSHWHALDATDCQGNTSSTQTQVSNDYKLNTNNELTCKDLHLTGGSYQSLAEGVEDFQIRYAEFDASTHTIQWKTANQVVDMAQVVAIEVCLRVASIATVHAAPPPSTQTGCQNEALARDGRLRRTFKQVMALRNRANVSP